MRVWVCLGFLLVWHVVVGFEGNWGFGCTSLHPNSYDILTALLKTIEEYVKRHLREASLW